jgi:CspA family cold shock protein
MVTSPHAVGITPKLLLEDTIMATGTVKWFNPTKGYGFIEPEDGGNDAFVHISAVESAGLRTLQEGQKVSYELAPGQNGKASAENLAVVD